MTQPIYDADTLAGQLLLLGATKKTKYWKLEINSFRFLTIVIHKSHTFIKIINTNFDDPSVSGRYNLHTNQSVLTFITNRLDK